MIPDHMKHTHTIIQNLDAHVHNLYAGSTRSTKLDSDSIEQDTEHWRLCGFHSYDELGELLEHDEASVGPALHSPRHKAI